MAAIIHPSAEVQTQSIGEGSIVWQYCVILPGAKIGARCNINFNVFIENDVVIGDNVTIKPGVQIWDGMRIADDVFIGPNATFTNDLAPRSKQYPEHYAKTLICRGASIGANATILAGITIGECAMVGAGSVVTKDIPPFTLWYGNPARQQGFVTRDGTILSLSLHSKDGTRYKLTDREPVIDD